MTDNRQQEAQQEAQRKADEARQHYDDAVAKMTDRNLFDRVRAAHPHAASSKEATDVMVKDYERLQQEQQTQQGTKPMSTAGLSRRCAVAYLSGHTSGCGAPGRQLRS